MTSVSPKSIKTKIPKSCLYKAMQSSDPTSHLVYVWKNRTSQPSTTNSSSLPSQKLSDSIQIATWNCRGLHNSIPYIKHLISTGVDILVLQEHWLWPFELSELDSIDSNFYSMRQPSFFYIYTYRGCVGAQVRTEFNPFRSTLTWISCDPHQLGS